MKPHRVLKNAIAQRRLLGIKDALEWDVSILIGKPRRSAQSKGFRCQYQILGLGDEKIRFAGGADSIQALELAFKKIGIDLYIEHQEVKFTCNGERGPGFPKPRFRK